MTDPTLALSFAAGILAFLSPCILPLVPSYMSFIGGVAVQELREGQSERWPVLLRTLLFVAGFTVVFVALGVVFAGSGLLFTRAGTIVNIVAGVIVIVLGLNIIFDFWKALNIERRVQLQNRPGGHIGAVLIGMAFGAGWTPCIGPILAGILFLAGTSGSVGAGVAYLIAFSLGLGVPFILAGVFFSRISGLLNRLKRHLPLIKTLSGVLLVIVGLLIAFGRLQQMFSSLVIAGGRLQIWDADNPVLSNWLFAAAVFVLLASPTAVAGVRRIRGNDAVRAFSTPKLVLATAALTIAVLNVTDVVSVATWFAGWFQYTGL